MYGSGKMFLKTRQLLVTSHSSIQGLSATLSRNKVTVAKLHLTNAQKYPEAKRIKLPDNLDSINHAETARWSPHRTRDITSPAILMHASESLQTQPGQFQTGNLKSCQDPHVDSYDCSGALSLNSSMQTNVPEPYASGSKSTHYNMPGGNWESGIKYIAEDMRSNHYVNRVCQMSTSAPRSGAKKFPNFPDSLNESPNIKKTNPITTPQLTSTTESAHLSGPTLDTTPISPVSNEMLKSGKETESETKPISKSKFFGNSKAIRQTFQQYGATAIGFHIVLSLMSLGAAYSAISQGLDVAAFLESFGLSNTIITQNLATNTGTFVAAYALHKVFAPVRMAATITCSPLIVRFFRKIGLIKT